MMMPKALRHDRRCAEREKAGARKSGHDDAKKESVVWQYSHKDFPGKSPAPDGPAPNQRRRISKSPSRSRTVVGEYVLMEQAEGSDRLIAGLETDPQQNRGRGRQPRLARVFAPISKGDGEAFVLIAEAVFGV